ncbi:hypothetical protein PF005_g2367 [Phytophthora fragariae]|uniref:Uncharacterized protein n=1 Tax=Phytophthora fragariae TaxID=53985 RepID=A0A6A3LV63_9STRA|nr:hypothetical protein PF009_g5573 [Phytophthora fragariae]KAE9023239.1 hypothetical protein PF011_g4082 [Phytophthora fragariae]KAE9127581.1 hypothetical protein PF007_g5567 [Phytophthora fragariae]KAE9134501.1 hypothetical protein PF010_g2434 [Phytophthora fragariae]KAE9149225.1 hypothetical protein PF006_g6279 [Phytophthora fragariae]
MRTGRSSSPALAYGSCWVPPVLSAVATASAASASMRARCRRYTHAKFRDLTKSPC